MASDRGSVGTARTSSSSHSRKAWILGWSALTSGADEVVGALARQLELEGLDQAARGEVLGRHRAAAIATPVPLIAARSASGRDFELGPALSGRCPGTPAARSQSRQSSMSSSACSSVCRARSAGARSGSRTLEQARAADRRQRGVEQAHGRNPGQSPKP